MVDLNIDISDKSNCNNNFLSDIYDTFSLQNIIIGKSCHKCNAGKSVHIMLTNRPKSFHKTGRFETGISNHHKLILSLFHSYSKEYHQKLLNIGSIKPSTNINFYII